MEDIQENSLLSSPPNQQLLSIDEELWRMAEERAQEILCIIQPNVISEVNRKDIIEFVQRLIGDYYGAEVFPFGSVPLKTYLPDGDIDLTVLSPGNSEEEMGQAVRNILGSGEDHEYEIKDIQYIDAQVKLVKCTVKGIAVDISFNQMGGLYALHFLERVDQLVGKNHLFKRSIILIKAWCYYESRILGAHHGLLSTYALETLVLYIINRFHSSVRGPLEVFFRFLDYYSTFDWESNYVTIDGPQALSSLPEIVEKPECDRVGLLLSKELLKTYRVVSSKAPTEFPTKPLNILDPLKHDNNLGRSVGRGNLHRIKFALSFGARKLKEIVTLPGESMGSALEMFFMNTLKRNGKGQRPDINVPVPAFGTGRSEESVLVGDSDSYNDGLQYIPWYPNYAMPPPIAHPSPPSAPSQADMLALQQSWSMFYPNGANLYAPGPSLYQPPPPPLVNYSINPEDLGRSRGTGTYIPDLNYNCYWETRGRMVRPRRFAPMNHNAPPRSHQRTQPEEVRTETDMNDAPRPFELSNEDFPVLPGIRKTSSSAILESKQDESKQDQSSSLQSKQDQSSSLQSKQPENVYPATDMNDNSRSFELSSEEFPDLGSIRNTKSSTSKESKQHQSSSPSQSELGTSSIPLSLNEMSLETKDQMKEKSLWSDEKKD